MRITSKAKRLAKMAAAFVSMTALLGVMATSYRTRNAEMNRMREELDALHDAYYTESMRGNSIRAQINQADDDAFIERVARREHGYTNPGEIHYIISNLPNGVFGVQHEITEQSDTQ